jgi:hypothetical protein
LFWCDETDENGRCFREKNNPAREKKSNTIIIRSAAFLFFFFFFLAFRKGFIIKVLSVI